MFQKSTDFFWLLLFAILWGFLIVIAAFAIYYGNYLAIVNGYDSFGNICGVRHNRHFENFSLSGTDTSLKPNVFLLGHFDALPNVIKICIEKCPVQDLEAKESLFEFAEEWGSHICRYDFNMSKIWDFSDFTYTHRLGPCPEVLVLESIPMRRVCVSEGELRWSEKVIKAYKKYGYGKAQPVFIYIFLARYYIAALVGIAFVVSIGTVILIYWQQVIASWFICVSALLTSVGLCTTLWIEHSNIDPNQRGTRIKSLQKGYYVFLVDDLLINQSVLYAVSVLSSVMVVLLLGFMSLTGKKIVGSKTYHGITLSCLKELPSILRAVFIALLALIGFLIFWTYVMLCITTANYPEVIQLNSTIKMAFKPWKPPIYDENYMSLEKIEYLEASTIRSLYWPYLLGFIWTIEFIFACERLSLAAAVVKWYFKGSLISPNQRCSLAGLLARHLGSLVKGSLFITILKVPSLILTGLIKGCKKWCNSTKLDFVEEFFEIWTCKAYIMVAMKDADFSSAGRMVRSSLKTIPDSSLEASRKSFFLLFLVKLMVVNLICLTGVLLLRDQDDLYFYMVPVLFGTALAFFIANTLMLAFEVVTDALILCVAEDKRLSGKTGHLIREDISKLFKINYPEAVKDNSLTLFIINTTNRQVSDISDHTNKK